MKHRHTRHLHAYWADLRGDAAAPLREAIEPAEIRSVLGDTFILENDSASAHLPFRLAGTRLCSLYGRELKDQSFLGLWPDSDLAGLKALLEAAATDGVCAVLELDLFDERGRHLPAEMLLLPLSRGGARHDRLLGLMVPLEQPYWLGLKPVVRQKLGSLRLIWPDETRDPLRKLVRLPAPPLALPPEMLAEARKHRHLRVLDGGRL